VTIVASVNVLGASFFSTHHASPEDVLAGRDRPATPPAYALLAGRARRFTSLVTQMHLEVCGALKVEGAEPPISVFATCHGEIQTAAHLLADFRDNAMVSSARFALSVHNTPSGLYSVATGSSAPSTTVTGDNAIAAGWLEAALTALDSGRNVLLSIADEPVPAEFHGPATLGGVAAAFLLAPGAAGHTIELAITPNANDVPVDPLLTLARAVIACMHPQSTSVVLGRIQSGSLLELHG
jgi:beta-ketoacyl synthase-like protein